MRATIQWIVSKQGHGFSLQYKSTCTYIKPEEWLYSETFRAGDGGGGHYIVSLPTESNYTTSLSNSTALV